MKIIIISFVFTMNVMVCLSQTQSLCIHETDSSHNGKGLRLGIFTPCNWTERENTVPNGVLKYLYKDSSSLETVSMAIGDIDNETSDAEAKSLFTRDGLLILTKGIDDPGPTNKIMANGIEGGEIMFKKVIPKDGGMFYFYCIQNYFFFKRRLILIQYTISSKTEEPINRELSLFRELAKRTMFN